MERPKEKESSSVAEGPTQGGDVPAWKAAAEPAVWTERMLAALENGVRGGKWSSLIDKVTDMKVLRAAWERVEANAGANRLLGEGRTWVVDADLKSDFDTIPTDRLMARMEEQVADGRVLKLLLAYLRQRVMDGLKAWTPDAGTPQGAVISPLLANVYLDPLDHAMAAAGFAMVRYADDFVILCRSREEAEAALARVRDWVAEAGLTLHPTKTRIVNEAQGEGFDVLGYHFQQGQRWPRRKSLDKFKEAIRQQTRRNNGCSLPAIVARLNPMLRGWYGYFKHSNRITFTELDCWTRHRLRAILLKRRGISRWRLTPDDHRQWPNAFFQEQGLFSLVTAHVQECQSRCRA